MSREAADDPPSTEGSFRGKGSHNAPPSVVSLFSGIGGFERAFELEGAHAVLQCESDRFCRAVLQRHWPAGKISNDIRTLSPHEIPDADIWTAGFPCQDVSLARGNHGRTGLKGNHTSLFFRLADLIEAKRPRVILLENVVGLLNSHKGQDFAVILRSLTELGYAVSWRVMNARYFGAPQSRARVFLCAWRGDYSRAVRALFESSFGAKVGSERAAFLSEHVHKRTGAIVPQIAYCVAATSGRHTGNDWSRSYISYADGVRRPTPTESERLQGFPADWTIPHDDLVTPIRGFDSERYRAVGNAVAIPVVRWIAARIVRLLSETDAGQPSAFPAATLRLAPDLRRNSTLVSFDDVETQIERGAFSYRWKAGGCAWARVAVEGAASAAPSKKKEAKFVDALDPQVPDDRYFLTPNAAVGILRRADSVGRNLFPPMRQALENLVRGGFGTSAELTGITGERIAQPRLCPPRAEQRGQVERACERPAGALRDRIRA